jgi:hypothetical protein
VLVPTALLAVTVNVYEKPFVRPRTTAEFPVLVAVWPPLLAVTVYRVIADPPLNAGVDHVTVALVSPILAATFVGASGAVAGVTEFEALDAVLVPTALLAVTVNVYVVPLFNPVIVIGDEPPVL